MLIFSLEFQQLYARIGRRIILLIRYKWSIKDKGTGAHDDFNGMWERGL